MFDDTENLLLAGSDSGEIYRGKAEIAAWLGGLFRQNSFEGDMKTIVIDSYENTAWVFVDGSMIVSNKSGVQFKTPYRFSGVLVNSHKAWKWRLFHGSIPGAE